MTKPNKRRVRMSQFQEQIAEAVLPPDGTVPIELDDERTVTIRIPLHAGNGDDEYVNALKGAKTSEDLALIVLGEEQWQTWQEAGYSADDLSAVFTAEGQAAKDRLRDFRYKG